MSQPLIIHLSTHTHRSYCFGPCSVDPVEQPVDFLTSVVRLRETNCEDCDDVMVMSFIIACR